MYVVAYIFFLHVLMFGYCEIEFIKNKMCDVIRENIIREIFKV